MEGIAFNLPGVWLINVLDKKAFWPAILTILLFLFDISCLYKKKRWRSVLLKTGKLIQPFLLILLKCVGFATLLRKLELFCRAEEPNCSLSIFPISSGWEMSVNCSSAKSGQQPIHPCSTLHNAFPQCVKWDCFASKQCFTSVWFARLNFQSGSDCLPRPLWLKWHSNSNQLRNT